MKKAVKLVLVTVMLLFVLSALACGKSSEPASESVQTEAATAEDLLGTWKGIGGEISTVSFAKNGAYRDDAGGDLYVAGTYKVDEASQTITVNEEEYGMVFVYDFSISNNTLTLQMNGGKERRFAKQ